MEFTLDEMRGHLATLEARIAEACKIAGRSRDSVKLVWVSKFHPAEAENRVQEAELKFSEPRKALNGERVRCHVIGPVQSNKLKKAAIVADCIHSIASIEAVEKLERVCTALPGNGGSGEQGKILDILFQVNAGEEETKSGLDVHEAEAFLAALAKRAGAASADGKSEKVRSAFDGNDGRPGGRYRRRLHDDSRGHGPLRRARLFEACERSGLN